MARTLGSRLMNILWGPVEEDDGMDYRDDRRELEDGPPPLPEPDPLPPNPTRRSRLSRREDNVVELSATRPQTEVRYPRTFEDAQELADILKRRAQLIVELEHVDEKDRTRLVHFLYGVAYGLDGKSHRINELTFVFAPRHFELETESPRRTVNDPGFVPRFSPPR